MAMAKVTRGAGYPVDPIFRVPPSPMQAKVLPLPDPKVANPGQYFQGFQPGYSGTNGSQGFFMPDAIVLFHSPDFYNCIEVDIETRKGIAGYVIPEKLALWLDDTIVPAFLEPIVDSATTGLYTHNGLPNDGANAQEFFRVRREDFVKQPLRTSGTFTGMDPSNSASKADTLLWRIYGALPFRYAYISYWMNLIDGFVPEAQYQCSFRVRVHYDPTLRVLRSVS